MNIFEPGDIVFTPFGEGTVVYRRMAPPDYATVAAYSVKLTAKAAMSPNYTGTLFFAKDVSAEPIGSDRKSL